jgi:hypothetical protein
LIVLPPQYLWWRIKFQWYLGVYTVKGSQKQS